MNMTLNFNIGILGHVDSGKTTLARALSKISSTAAFDKHPQSKERGITLDLGFSALVLDIPKSLRSQTTSDKIQYTFVDCPGHASLIRTIIGGAQIIDMMLLVIDIQKGFQTQTAECLVISEITRKKVIVVINKIDMIPTNDTEKAILKMKTKIQKVLQTTSINTNVPIYAISALNGINIDELINGLQENVFIPVRNPDQPFHFSVDHCFSIKGQGTVCTGTVLQGSVSVNDVIEIPVTNECKKVKSIQIFKQPVQNAKQGDRIGLCVTQFNANLMERGAIGKPGFISHVFAIVVPVTKIKYYKNTIKSNSKFHISIGHETVMGKITLFQRINNEDFYLSKEYEYLEELSSDNGELNTMAAFAIIEFETSVLAVPNALVIVSKLDINVHTNSCRIAFWGNIIWSSNSNTFAKDCLPNFKIFKNKLKEGNVQRVVNETELIIHDLFKKEAKKDLYIGKKIVLSTGEEGIIESTFGQTTKLKVRFFSPIAESTLNCLKTKSNDVKVVLKFKKFVFNKNNSIIQ